MAKKETPTAEEGAQTAKEDALGVFRAFSRLQLYRVRLHRNPPSTRILTETKHE